MKLKPALKAAGVMVTIVGVIALAATFPVAVVALGILFAFFVLYVEFSDERS